MMTRVYSSRSIAALNRKNLPMNPAVAGMPASDTRQTVRGKLRMGWRKPRPR